MDTPKAFWNAQNSSLHRDSSAAFYRGKAEEHASLISPEDRSAGIVDLGCGAGELLEQLAGLVKIDAALDFSDAMLAEARRRLADHSDVALINADLFAYLPKQRHAVWTTTGAINQYLDRAETMRFLDLFAKHPDAHALYLFDCVDPLRYALLPYGLSYRPEHLDDGQTKTFRARVGRPVRLTQRVSKLLTGGFTKDFQYLGSAGMGYGAPPRFWLLTARNFGLHAQIVSSRYYEYRYHVLLHKDAGRV